MDAFIDPAADHIWDAVAITVTAKGREEKYPRTDEEWKELRRRAIQIMEGANLLLVPGRRVAGLVKRWIQGSPYRRNRSRR